MLSLLALLACDPPSAPTTGIDGLPFPLDGFGTVTLSENTHEDWDQRLSVELLSGPVTANLDGNGPDERVAVIRYSTGGSGGFRELLVFSGDTFVDSHFLGDRVAIEGLTVTDDRIQIDMVTHGPDDGMCCPTQRTTGTYRLKSGALVVE